MEIKRTKGEKTRQHIIEATAGIFNVKGYAGTSLSDLTKATGLSKGGIYGNFGGKEEIAAAAFDFNHEKLKNLLLIRIAKAHTFREKLLAYSEVYNRYSDANFPKGGCPVLNTAIEADDTNALLKARSTMALMNWKDSLVKLIREGVKKGEFIETPHDEQISLSLIALIEGGIMIAKATDNHRNMDAVMQTFRMIIDRLCIDRQ
jgi:TetR/AcrR family transcriptional repressor of nem operon